MKVLVLNSGSSSQKSSLHELGDSLPQDPPVAVWEARIEWDGGTADLQVSNSHGATVREQVRVEDRQTAIERMLDTLWSGSTRVIASASEIDVVGHRVVHGGHKLEDATVVTPEVKSIIASVAVFAPLHNRAELEGIEIVERLVGGVRQVVVFDTGFHRTLPLPAAVYPGPYEWLEQGIRRYGFHGINHQYCAQRSAHLLGRDPGSLKLVSCHLGNGCSLAAIRGGVSVDTTMGFTPLDGLMMGTRSGAVDPGILTYLMRQSPVTGEQLDATLNQKSGLLGISGVSGDMRQILAAIKSGNQRAQLAFDMYVRRLQAGIGAMATVLGGMDALIFTAGVGEHSPEVRAATCEKLGFLGVQLDREKNSQSPADQEISTPESTVRVLIIRAQEDWAIAKACWTIAPR
ncbi:MAG: acetate kinase [Acidobacteriia bacterium]|nr:acetate kinase [Terriglobia bacterium]